MRRHRHGAALVAGIAMVSGGAQLSEPGNELVGPTVFLYMLGTCLIMYAAMGWIISSDV